MFRSFAIMMSAILRSSSSLLAPDWLRKKVCLEVVCLKEGSERWVEEARRSSEVFGASTRTASLNSSRVVVAEQLTKAHERPKMLVAILMQLVLM
jgi:hypothetical protein